MDDIIVELYDDGSQRRLNLQAKRKIQISAAPTNRDFHDAFLRQNRIALLPKIEDITIYDDTAGKIVMTVGMAGTNDGVLGFSADAYRFALELEKDADEWQLISARWGELGDELR